MVILIKGLFEDLPPKSLDEEENMKRAMIVVERIRRAKHYLKYNEINK